MTCWKLSAIQTRASVTQQVAWTGQVKVSAPGQHQNRCTVAKVTQHLYRTGTSARSLRPHSGPPLLHFTWPVSDVTAKRAFCCRELNVMKRDGGRTLISFNSRVSAHSLTPRCHPGALSTGVSGP